MNTGFYAYDEKGGKLDGQPNNFFRLLSRTSLHSFSRVDVAEPSGQERVDSLVTMNI